MTVDEFLDLVTVDDVAKISEVIAALLSVDQKKNQAAKH
jgi:ribosome maturation factor RimP